MENQAATQAENQGAERVVALEAQMANVMVNMQVLITQNQELLQRLPVVSGGGHLPRVQPDNGARSHISRRVGDDPILLDGAPQPSHGVLPPRNVGNQPEEAQSRAPAHPQQLRP